MAFQQKINTFHSTVFIYMWAARDLVHSVSQSGLVHSKFCKEDTNNVPTNKTELDTFGIKQWLSFQM